jgi:pimeloyl-ACP methyl ester carboxylesterase
LELLVRPTGHAGNIKVSVPALVLHGDSDQTVSFEGSGRRAHEAIAGSGLYLIADAPHGCNVSHAEDFIQALPRFLAG